MQASGIFFTHYFNIYTATLRLFSTLPPSKFLSIHNTSRVLAAESQQTAILKAIVVTEENMCKSPNSATILSCLESI